MRIVSWNVNGLRAIHRKGFWQWLINQDFDVICLQETKASPDQLPEEVKNPVGYFSYFDIPKERKGYSGVAIYTKTKPESVEYIMGNSELDKEGRLIAVHYKDLVIITCYFPNGGSGPDRLEYKLNFYKAFQQYVENIRNPKSGKGKSIIFCGDINTAHEPIDLARPKENENNTGFLPIERLWIDEIIKMGYIDIWRTLNPNKVEYTWWDMKTFARERNVGWRIDYFFISKDLISKVKKSENLCDVFGSDHCPVFLELDN